MIKASDFKDLKGRRELCVTLYITGKHYTKLRKLASMFSEWPHITLIKIMNGFLK